MLLNKESNPFGNGLKCRGILRLGGYKINGSDSFLSIWFRSSFSFLILQGAVWLRLCLLASNFGNHDGDAQLVTGL